MRIGYLECFAGISGDMLMGAFVDAGAPVELLQRTAASLALGAELRISKVNRSGIQATKVDVLVEDKVHEPAAATGPAEHHHEHHHHHPHNHAREHEHEHTHDDGHPHEHGRSLPQIRALLSTAGLTQGAHELSLSAFGLLARAEGRIHGVPWEEVHFHEVGAIDAIVDIACCAAAADALGVEAWYCSAVNVGSGFVNCAHGRFPVPAPATAELLKDKPVYSAHVQVELATPTGAALLRALECRFEPIPVMRIQAIGYGAGTRNLERFPNVVRLNIGEVTVSPETSPQPSQEKVTVLECAVDDLSPQVLANTAQLALERGALDVMSAAVTMKKGRLGTLLTVLCKAGDAELLQQLIFRETTTLGIRVREENRVVLAREITAVQTAFGMIRVKAGSSNGEEWNAAPEFEDCRRAAAGYDVPLKTVMQAALAAWRTRQSGSDLDPAATTLQAGSRS
jgi:pyridinium-3,5-bisthiocarboxylic acid mononucleotide nickel chelatase